MKIIKKHIKLEKNRGKIGGIRTKSLLPELSINTAFGSGELITKCHNDSMGLKLVYIWIFDNIFCHF